MALRCTNTRFGRSSFCLLVWCVLFESVLNCEDGFVVVVVVVVVAAAAGSAAAATTGAVAVAGGAVEGSS